MDTKKQPKPPQVTGNRLIFFSAVFPLPLYCTPITPTHYLHGKVGNRPKPTDSFDENSKNRPSKPVSFVFGSQTTTHCLWWYNACCGLKSSCPSLPSASTVAATARSRYGKKTMWHHTIMSSHDTTVCHVVTRYKTPP